MVYKVDPVVDCLDSDGITAGLVCIVAEVVHSSKQAACSEDGSCVPRVESVERNRRIEITEG